MLGTVWASVVENVGTFSGILFILQLLAQIRYYGLREWIREGMGVGVTRQEADVETEDG